MGYENWTHGHVCSDECCRQLRPADSRTSVIRRTYSQFGDRCRCDHRGRPIAEVLLWAENRNRKLILVGPKPSVSLMPACQGPKTTVPDADVDSAVSFLGYRYIVSQYTVRLMTPCVWRILCLRNSSSVPYFQQPPNLPTAALRNRKCTECGTTAFGRNRMSAESDHLSTFGAETEAEIRSTSSCGTAFQFV